MSADNEQRMRRVGIWLGEQFGNVPFFVGVQPADGVGPLSISSLDTQGQIRLLASIQESLRGPTAQVFVDGDRAPIASSLDVSHGDVETVLSLLRVMLSTWPQSPRRDAFARVVRWLEAWSAAAVGG